MAGLAIDSIVIQSWLRAGEKGGPKSQLCQEKIDWEQRCFLVDCQEWQLQQKDLTFPFLWRQFSH